MSKFLCECECHRRCHVCGGMFIGPNDYHVNCGDTMTVPQHPFVHVEGDRFERQAAAPSTTAGES